jgi:hypothetical protein
MPVLVFSKNFFFWLWVKRLWTLALLEGFERVRLLLSEFQTN